MDTLISITLWNVVLLGGLLLLQPAMRVVISGLSYALSNFDERREEGVFARRLAMVCANQVQALALWVPVVVIAAAVIPDFSPPSASVVATVFLIARLAYATVSLAGIPFLRSGAWIIGFAAWAYLTWAVMGSVAW